MSNMTFGVNLIPSQDNTYSLGNSTNKWNVYADTINGVDPANMGLPSGGTAGQVLTKNSSTAGDAGWANAPTEVMQVTFTSSSSYTGNISNLSHTYAQITDALSQGKVVFLYDTSNKLSYMYAKSTSTAVLFTYAENQSGSTLSFRTVTINSTSGWKSYINLNNLHPDIDVMYMEHHVDGTFVFSQWGVTSPTLMDLKYDENHIILLGYKKYTGSSISTEEWDQKIVYYVLNSYQEEVSAETGEWTAATACFYTVSNNFVVSKITIQGEQFDDLNDSSPTVTVSDPSTMPYNGDWKTAPIGLSLWYYDTTSASTYDVPSGASFVVVIRHTYSNAVAMCFKYTSNPQYMGWNRMNGNTWSGWDHLVLTGSLSSNNGTYINTVNGSWERHDKVVTFTCQFTMKTAITTSLSTAISGLPASSKPSMFLVNENAVYTNVNTGRVVTAYNGYLYLGGPFSTGVTYTVSGSYVI